jgi:PPOX class probable F420-dependent enzyme
MVAIPEEFRELLTRPILVSLATVMPDGQPQVTPVWIDYDGTYILVNTAASHQKAANMAARQQATILAIDPEDGGRYLEIRGKVVKITPEGGDAHIDALARKYLGVESYPWRNDRDTRLICSIEPQRVRTQGGWRMER